MTKRTTPWNDNLRHDYDDTATVVARVWSRTNESGKHVKWEWWARQTPSTSIAGEHAKLKGAIEAADEELLKAGWTVDNGDDDRSIRIDLDVPTKTYVDTSFAELGPWEPVDPGMIELNGVEMPSPGTDHEARYIDVREPWTHRPRSMVAQIRMLTSGKWYWQAWSADRLGMTARKGGKVDTKEAAKQAANAVLDIMGWQLPVDVQLLDASVDDLRARFRR